MASDLKSDLVSKSYDMGPHVKLMGNPAVIEGKRERERERERAN